MRFCDERVDSVLESEMYYDKITYRRYLLMWMLILIFFQEGVYMIEKKQHLKPFHDHIF